MGRGRELVLGKLQGGTLGLWDLGVRARPPESHREGMSVQELLELQRHEAPERQRWVQPPLPPPDGLQFLLVPSRLHKGSYLYKSVFFTCWKAAPKENVRVRRDESHTDDQRR